MENSAEKGAGSHTMTFNRLDNCPTKKIMFHLSPSVSVFNLFLSITSPTVFVYL